MFDESASLDLRVAEITTRKEQPNGYAGLSAAGRLSPARMPAQPAIANLAGGANLSTTVSKVNALLAALRSAGVISP